MTRKDHPKQGVLLGSAVVPRPPAPAQRHSAPSREAAERIEPKVPALERLVLHQLWLSGKAGATDEELIAMTGLEGNTLRPRRRNLVKSSLVRDSGRTRLTRSGRKATVWVSTNPQ